MDSPSNDVVQLFSPILKDPTSPNPESTPLYSYKQQ